MAIPAERPPERPERPQWHFRSVFQYIAVGLVIVVVGTVAARWVASAFFGDDESEAAIDEVAEINVDEATEINVDEPTEVIIKEPGEVNVDEPSELNIVEPPEVNVDEPTEVIIKEPGEVIIEQPAAQTSEPPPEPTSAPTAGDCDRFPVYAQGRWPPPGAAIRSEPTRAAPQTDSVQPNVIISVDGWVRSDAPYPTNNPPWNENVWFRLTDRSGWVSFAGVRASPSHPGDTDGLAEGGWPVELLDECEIPTLTKG